MTHTTQSVTNTFRAANIIAPDEDMAAMIAETMAMSGYPDDQLKVALAHSKSASPKREPQPTAFGS
jgi:hypothetical protein